MTKELTKNNTFNLVYKREYQDSEDYDFFPIYYTIFRNIPIKFLNKLNSDVFKRKVKSFCDKNFNESGFGVCSTCIIIRVYILHKSYYFTYLF